MTQPLHARTSSRTSRRSALKTGVFLTLLLLPYCFCALSAFMPIGYTMGENTLQNPLLGAHLGERTNQGPLLRENAPASQSNRIIVILIKLSDEANSTSMQTINSTVYQKMASYFDEVSYHRMEIVGNVTSWIPIGNTTEQYGKDTGAGSSGIDDVDGDGIFDSWWLIRDAVEIIDNTTNFMQYDTVMVVHSGMDQAQSSTSNDIWSAYYSGLEIPTNDGQNITSGIVISEDDPMGIFAHEFGHSLGLPDLYNAIGGAQFVGKWDLMANGAWQGSPQGETPSHPTSYCKIHLGWILENATMVGRMIQGVIDPLEIRGNNLTVMKIPVTTDTYYLVEVRQKTGYDAYLPSTGVLILYVDEALLSGEGIVKVKYSQTLDQATYTTETGKNMYIDDTRNINITILSAYSASYRVMASLVRPDNIPPEISLTYPVPWAWPGSQPATVEAVITDSGTSSSSVRNATLFYSSDGGQSWNRIQMMAGSGDVFSAVIPAQNSLEVSYYIEAYDYAGNLAIANNNGEYYVYRDLQQTLATILIALIGVGFVCTAAVLLVRRRNAMKEKVVTAPVLYN